ncbi:MAG: hypothetical protein LIO79_00940 [Rikenellaceae bacterium]|nr:hypothetical protein [Rikenellaceae bacterium]
MLCESWHGERTQYELIYDILADPRFAAQGGVLFTEVGSRIITGPLNNFLQGPDVTDEELHHTLKEFQRWYTWMPWGYTGSGYDLMETIYRINRTSTDGKMVTWYPSDIVLDWKNIKTKEEYDKFFEKDGIVRDSLMADRIISVYDSIAVASTANPKALVIMNYRHAYGNEFMKDAEVKPQNTGRYLFEHYQNKIANVFIHSTALAAARSDNDVDMVLTNDGKWDAAFAITGKRNIGFDFNGSPFGEDDFDHWIANKGKHIYQDVFNGYIFYKPVDEWIVKTGVNGMMEDGYIDTVLNFIKIIYGDDFNEEAMREEVIKWNEVQEEDNIGQEYVHARDKWLE